ncbi:MAG: glutathione S-transferase [Alphaproteobacteria bacterium]|nr:glutathione S-transferase [Alphaproteobacteria bacterium]
MADLRIISYLPNPRIWKAAIAGRLCDVDIEVRGGAPDEMQDWLWDFDARPLTDDDRQADQSRESTGRRGFKGRLYKTEAFLDAIPFGTIPAAFSPDGKVGVFESNSIMRAVAKLGQERGHGELSGRDAYEAARIESFLDVSLLFAKDSQAYLLSLRGETLTTGIYQQAAEAFGVYLRGIERALSSGTQFIASNQLSLADICFVAELALFMRETMYHDQLQAMDVEPIFGDRSEDTYPKAIAHFEGLCRHEAFKPDVEPYLQGLRR